MEKNGNKSNDMVDAGEYTFADTLKPAEVTKEMKTRIVEMKVISTKYGDKRVAVIDGDKQVFLNSMSLQNLVEGFGNNTKDWEGHEILVNVEVSERTQGKSSIVVSPVKE